jgi:nucleoid-associated protein YgaU
MKQIYWFVIPVVFIGSVLAFTALQQSSQAVRIEKPNIAENLIREEKWNQAVEQFEKELVLHPNSAETYLQLGILYEDHLADDAKAAKNYRKFLELQPKSEKAEMVNEWINELQGNRVSDTSQLSMNELKRKLALAEKQLQTALKEQERLNSKIDQYKGSLERLEASVQEKSDRNEDLHNEILKLKDQKQQLDVLRADLNKTKDLYAATRGQFQRTSEQLMQSQVIIEEFKKQFVDAEKEILDLEDKNQNLQNQLEELKKRGRSSGVRDNYRTSYATTLENEKLRDQIKSLEAKNLRYYGIIGSLKTTNGDLRRQLLQTRGDIRSGGMKTYRVKKGESLRTIAIQFYGNKDKWMLIYNANRAEINNPDLLTPGQVLNIPSDSEE